MILQLLQDRFLLVEPAEGGRDDGGPKRVGHQEPLAGAELEGRGDAARLGDDHGGADHLAEQVACVGL